MASAFHPSAYSVHHSHHQTHQNQLQHIQQYVVVWECLQQACSGSNPKDHDRSSIPPNRWKPYTPAVSQILEKAYRSRLTQVLLGDADPALSKFRVSLTSMVQICEFSEEVNSVRRMLYPRSSPAGQGIRWDWLGDRPSEWNDFDMSGQMAIESAYASGLQTVDLSLRCQHLPYIINFCNMTQVRRDTGFVRSIRRQTHQATYPAALKNEIPEVSADPPPKREPSGEKSIKGNWLAGIISVVKSPSKSHNSEAKAHSRQSDKSAHVGVNFSSHSSTNAVAKGKSMAKVVPSRRESRSSTKSPANALRLERRARSSSLDTIFTTLS